MTKKIRVLSGIRASHSSLHLGNLKGAIEGMVSLQENPDCETFYMVADLHGITTKYDPKVLHKNRLEVVKDYLAAGIDPKKSVLFLQSDLFEHTELAYLLASVSSVPRLLRMPSKKDEHKLYMDEGQLTGTSFALLGYPVLMAADILLYKAHKVPIGMDQEPHLEFTREIARKLNKKYGLDFPIPDRYAVIAEDFTVPSVKGKGKMSKSIPESAIFLNDSREEVRRKVAGIPTDSGKGGMIRSENVFFKFVILFMLDRYVELEEQYKNEGVRYGELKAELASIISDRLDEIQKKRKYYEDNPDVVQKILDEGAERARKVASETLSEVKEKMGLSR